MNEWKEYKLSEVIVLIGGGTPKTSNPEYWNGEIPWLSVVDFNNGNKFVYVTEKTISDKGLRNSNTKLLKKGDIILSARGTVGAIAILAKEMTFNQSCYGIRNVSEFTHQEFLFYLLRESINSLKQISHGGVFDTITKNTFEAIDVLLPDLKEQKAIASVLSSLDEKIDLLHRQNKTLEAMAETLFRQWFIEQSDTYQNCRISDLIDFNPKRELSKGKTAPYLEMANVSTNTFNPLKWYDRDFSSGMKFENGDTLLARITPCLENGKAAYVTFLDVGQVGWGSTEFIVLRTKPNIHSFFSYILCRNNDFKEYAESCLEGSSGRQRVNVNHLEKYEINFPSDEIIMEFNNLASSIVPKLINNGKQIKTLEKFRDTLLPKLMSGEVRIKS